MFGKLLSLAASRLAASTIDTVERKIVWSAIGGIFFVAGLIFILMFSYFILAAYIGSLRAAGVLALACVVVGIVGFWMPPLLNWIERQASDADEKSSVAEFAETVDEEAHNAVDVLGPVQVVASAFMAGLTAGRSVRGQRHQT